MWQLLATLAGCALWCRVHEALYFCCRLASWLVCPYECDIKVSCALLVCDYIAQLYNYRLFATARVIVLGRHKRAAKVVTVVMSLARPH